MWSSLPGWVRELLPIVVLLTVISAVVGRLPKVDVGHSQAFRTRRFWNWFPAGMTYAFLYFARYNLIAYKNAVAPHGGSGTLVAGESVKVKKKGTSFDVRLTTRS